MRTIQETLAHTVERKSHFQRIGERSGARNTIIFDPRVLLDPVARASAQATVKAFRARPWLMQGVSRHHFAVYVMGNYNRHALTKG